MTPADFQLQPKPRQRGEARCRTCGDWLTVQELETNYCPRRDVTACRLECEGEKR